MKNKIEILIPTYNEEGNIKSTIIELKKNGFRNITILDAQSEDNTVLVAKKLNCKIIIDKKKKIGFGHSLINGFKSSKHKYCCIFDGDGSFNPKAINKMIVKIKKGNDFIFGSRYLGGNKSDDDTFITTIGNFFFTKLISLLFNFKTTDALFLYTLAETKKWKSLKLKEQDFKICTEILIKANNAFICKEVFSKERKRKYGVSKVNKIQDGVNLLKNIFQNFLNLNN